MSASHDSTDSDEPLGRLLLRLAGHLIHLLAPIVLVAMLPLPWTLAPIALLALAQLLCVYLGARRVADEAGFLLVTAILGAAFPLAAWFPGWWGVPVAAVAVLFGLAACATLARRLGLATITPEPARAAAQRGASAWGGGEPTLTPEGEPIRLLARGEIAMGGPSYCDYLFADGVLLQGLGGSALFSNDGRYFVAPIPSRQRWGLLVLDRQARLVYRFVEIDCFWELDAFEKKLLGRCSPLTDDKTYELDLRALLAQSTGVALRELGDLWLEPDDAWQLPDARDYPAPEGRQLHAEPWLPASLLALDDPLQPLRHPLLRLALDGQDSGLLLDEAETPVWDAGGLRLACRAQGGVQRHGGYWCWQSQRGWWELPRPWVEAVGEPGLLLGAVEGFEEDALLITAELALGELDQLLFGYGQMQVYSPIQVIDGHDARGRAQLRERAPQRLQLVLPLQASATERGCCRIRIATPAGQRLELRWLRDSADGRLGAYACELDGKRLPGEWQLTVRTAQEGRYLALLAFADAPAAAGEVAVLDVPRAQFWQLALKTPLGRLLDFSDMRLCLSEVVGRLDDTLESTPLQRFNRQSPGPARAAAFLAETEGSRLCYRERHLQLTAQGLQVLPPWRLVDRPQAANAEGDFVLPSPPGDDAAWLFGAQSEYRDSYPRERHPRQGGCLLTASGVALADLTPALVWSADGRYLVVTRLRESDDWHDFAPRRMQWVPYLLDVRARCLYGPGPGLGCMPLFEGLAGGRLSLRVFDSDWQVDEEAGAACVLALETMLGWPVQTLGACGRLWLETDERARAGQWLRLDDDHLDTWRAKWT